MTRQGNNEMSAVRSVMRAFDILGQLAKGPQGVLEMSRELGLPKTTVYRLLATLEQLHVVYRSPGSQEYELGPYLVYLGHCVGSARALQEVALGPMRELRDQYGETVNLNIAVHHERVCIASLESRNSLRAVSVVGERSPLHSGAAARSILAFLPDAFIEEYIRAMPSRKDDRGPEMSEDELRRAIQEARELGYVVSRGERTPGVTSVGVPIRDREGRVVGSVNLSGPSQRMDARDLNELAAAVGQAAERISLALGYASQAAMDRPLDAARRA